MSVFEVVGGGDRRSMVRRYEKKSKYDAIHELVDIIQCNWRQLELLEKENKLLRGPEETVTSARGDKLFAFMSKDPCRYRLCEVTYAAPVRVLIAERDALRAEVEELRAKLGSA